MEDIRELDAKVMTRVLENMIKAVEELLVVCFFTIFLNSYFL